MIRFAMLVGGAALAAAGAGPAQAIDAGALDPCGMLSAKAVSAEVGKAVAEGRKTNEAGGGKSKSRMVTCTWDAGKDGGVNLILWAWATPKRAGDYIEQFRKVAKETGSAALSPLAIGEEAALDGASVHVRKGINTFTVTVQIAGAAAQKSAGSRPKPLRNR